MGTRTNHPLRRAAVAVAAALTAVATVGVPPAAASPRYQEVTGADIAVNGTYVPLVGQFANGEPEDIIWYSPGSGVEQVWIGQGSGTPSFAKQPLQQQVNGTYKPIVGDFSGDSWDDILWYAPGSGVDHLWTRTASHTFTDKAVTINGTYSPYVLRDSRAGGGKDDILFRSGSGPDVLWSFPDDGSGNRTSYAFNLPAGTPLLGDFDANGAVDVFWYQAGSGADALWRRASGTSGTFTVSAQSVNGSYQPVVGRFDWDADAHADILWFGSGAAPDTVWEGAAAGTWNKHGTSIPQAGTPIRKYEANEDNVVIRGTSSDVYWFPTPDGVGMVSNTANTHPDNVAKVFSGGFKSGTSGSLFFYTPGATPELMLT